RAAEKLTTLAYIRLLQGQKKVAITTAEAALEHSKTLKVRFLAGRVLATAGQVTRAKALADELSADVKTEAQAYGKLIEAELALSRGDPRAAIKASMDANAQVDTWIGRFDLGRAYLEAKAYPEADSEFDQCIRRRGEALSLFLDETPSYGYFPLVYYYLGRVREGMGSKGFAESYQTYQSIRGKAGEDPLLPEIRKRAGRKIANLKHRTSWSRILEELSLRTIDELKRQYLEVKSLLTVKGSRQRSIPDPLHIGGGA